MFAERVSEISMVIYRSAFYLSFISLTFTIPLFIVKRIKRFLLPQLYLCCHFFLSTIIFSMIHLSICDEDKLMLQGTVGWGTYELVVLNVALVFVGIIITISLWTAVKKRNPNMGT